MQLDNIIGNYKTFLDRVFRFLEDAKIDLNDTKELDHIAYRVTTSKRYQEMKDKLDKIGIKISENIIRNRPIANYKLKNNIIYKNFTIPCIELPAPAEGDNFKEGLEHAEFVTKIPLKKFLEKYKQLPFDTKGIAKERNADLILNFKSCAIKFHEQSIIKIIQDEQR